AKGDVAGVARLLGAAVDRITDADPRELHRQLCRLGRAREHLGDAEGALDAYRRARAIDSTSLLALKGLGAILVRRGAWAEALPVLEAILAHHRDALSPAELAVTCGWVGQILERQGWSERAAENFEKALEADPEHVPSLRGMARTLQARGDWSRAAGLLDRLLKMPEVQADHVGAAKLHLELAEILRDRVGDEDLALHHLDRALDADPRLVKAFAALEQTLAAKRRWRDLAKAIERMIERLPPGGDSDKARVALWKELGALQQKALGDVGAARVAYEQVVKASPDDLEALQSWAELASAVPGQEEAAADGLRRVALRQKDPSKVVSRMLQVLLARKDLDRAYAAADVLAHLLRTANAEELETVDRLRRLSREFATRSLDDVLWQRLLHDRLRSGPVPGILTLLARDAGALFVQSAKDLGLNPQKDEVDLASSGLTLANGIKYAARALGIDGVRLFRVAGSPMRLGFANTDPPSLVAGDETSPDRPRRELWFVAARAVSYYRPELRLARLMPHDQLQAVFQAAVSVGVPTFVPTADMKAVQKVRGPIERALRERGKLPALTRMAEEYAAAPRPGEVRAYMDAVELTSNRAGALLAGDLQVARRLVLEEKAQVSKLLDDVKVKDLVQFCLSEDWAVLREALGLSVAAR
ncbi:MAG: tetratricopeptide repeat protein, partial [Anaeromyxobacteraceae bacterium]